MEEPEDPCHQRIDLDTQIAPTRRSEKTLKKRKTLKTRIVTIQDILAAATLLGIIIMSVLSSKPEWASGRGYDALNSFFFIFVTSALYDRITTEITLQRLEGRIGSYSWSWKR
jgi:hypothetical protein